MTETVLANWRDAEFRKSSYSGGQDDSCVEFAWRKSSYSGGANNQCVELGHADEQLGVRDSKNQRGPVLAVTAARGLEFVHAVRNGLFDH